MTPPGWKVVKFKEIAKQKSDRVDNPSESGFERYVGLEHLDSGALTVKRWGSTADVNSAMKLFKADDLLFARRNTYLRRVSVAQFDGVCSGDIIVIEPILKEIVKGFLPIYMQFEPFENRVISLSAGAFSKRIKWKQLIEEDVLLPPKDVQQKIVDLVWSVQDNIEKTENLIAINEKLKKGLLQELLTKGIGHKKFKQTEIGEIPEEWEIVELKDIFNVVTGTTPSTKISEYWSPEEVNWYTPLDLGRLGTDIHLHRSNKQISRKGLEKTNLKIIPENTVIISTRAPVGYVGITTTDSTINQGCKAIVPIGKESPDFFAEYIVYSNIRLSNLSGGSTFQELTKKSLEQFKVIRIPYDEQIIIHSKINSIAQSIIYLQKNAVSLNNLKKKLTDDILKSEVNI